MKVKIIVATHKITAMPQNKDLYMPILVGATKNFREGITFQRDDEGNNISDKNSSYNELTALYWAWKNLNNVDVIGLVQYRRYFFKKFKIRNLNNVLDESDVIHLMKNKDAILPKKRHYYIETNYSHYIHAHYQRPLDEARRIIIKLYPTYLSSFDKIMSRRSAHMFNMFIMKKRYFSAYCKWLFNILKDVENIIDVSSYPVQEKRVFGYLSELLLDVWIDKNNISFCESRWEIIGNRHIVEKAYFFMARKFKINKKTHFE